jgi:hypothetical protein
MPSPGWYTDPQDPSGLRWFDGEQWTEHQSPGTEAVSPSASPSASPAVSPSVHPADQTVTLSPESLSRSSSLFGDSATGAVDLGATVIGPSGAAPAGAGYRAADYGATDYGATVAGPAYSGGGYDAGAGYGAATPAYQPVAPAHQPWSPTPGVPYAGAPSGGGPQKKKPSNKLIIIVAAAVVAVLVLGIGGWLLFKGGDGSSFTFQGKAVSRPADALSQGESNLRSIVVARHGAENNDTRCYYAVPTAPTAGVKKTDVDTSLRCGPVLFVDGDTGKDYLSFALNSTTSGSGVALHPSAAPKENDPAAAPSGLTLKRPDGKTAPPAADPDVLTTAALTPAAGTTPTVSNVGSLAGGVSISNLGKISRYGTGDDARSAASGQQLYAFKLAGAAGNDGTVKDLSSSVTLSVDGAAGKTLPVPKTGQYIIVGVPTGAKTVDLVLTDSGIKQTLSLLDNKPGATNILVLARAHRTDTTAATVTVTLNYSTRVVFSDNVTAQTQTAAVALSGATLTYRDDTNAVSASSPANAFLIPDIVYTGSHDGGPFGIDTALLTFTPTGGAAIPATNISKDPAKIRNVFEVPAGITTGTLTIGGTATETFSNGGGSYTLTVAAPMTIPITFAAN